ncbi:glycosyltransferase family 2 protein [Salinibacterium sp. SYSU T00001]|uniref:glycosyltransferase family 2 protein n=1 Tax=Homoserinimonas sedimenticola TaxID=2986805 RepID=UPI002235D110|nr:glycosyltransferase family 2 protein [Salinibacterium sedimenticola]MCW4385453.1 glycosyltransferase family 2 protein [Salinibacterium sedimenticola]
MSAEPIAVIVVNYGSHNLLERNLPTDDLAREGIGVVVVDNHSSHLERDALGWMCAERGWHLVTQDNLGFGGGVNRGIAEARMLGYRRYVMLNPDAVADAAAIAALADHVSTATDSLVAPTILDSSGEVWFAGGTVLVERGVTVTRGADSAAPNGWLTGACLAVHDSLWQRLRGFDDRYFLYWEDIDLSWRCVEAGGRLVVRDDIRVHHDAGGTQGGGRAKSATYYRYNCRNRLLFAARHLERRDAIRWVLLSPAYAWRVLLRGGRRQFLRQPWRPLWAALAGTAGGVWMLASERMPGLRRRAAAARERVRHP